MTVINIIERTVMGDQRVTIADITFSDSYPTGGEAINPQLLGLDVINFVWAPPTAGYLLEYDYAGNKMLALYPTADAAAPAVAEEVADQTDLETLTVRCMFFGR